MPENPRQPPSQFDSPNDTDAWHFLTRYPPTFLSAPRFIAMMRAWVTDAAARPDFAHQLRQASRAAIEFADTTLVRQGLQCLAFTGTYDDLQAIEALTKHEDPLVAKDARTCAFEICHGSRPDV
jgi:hypothetical protein